jgi:hypothetical protein
MEEMAIIISFAWTPQISITAISARMLVSKCRYFTTKLVRCSIIWVILANRLTRLEMIILNAKRVIAELQFQLLLSWNR